MKLAATFLLFACILPAAIAADSSPPPLEPGFEYFAADHFRTPKICPAAKSIGFIARTGKTTQLFRLDLATGKIGGIFDPGEGDVENFWWVDDHRLLIQARGKNGTVYFSLNLATAKLFELRKPDRNDVFYDVRVLPKIKDSVVVVRFDLRSTRIGFSYTAINVDTGKERLLGQPRGWYQESVISPTGEIIAEGWRDGGTWKVRWREFDKSPWKKIEGNSPLPDFYPIGLHSDERHLLVVAYDQGDTSALMLLDPATGKRSLLAQKPQRDFIDPETIPSSPYPTGALFHGVAEINAVPFEPADGTLLRRVEETLPGNNTRIVDSTRDGTVRVIANWSSGQPESYFVYAGGRLAFLNSQRESPASERLGKTRAFTYTTRDGLQEHGSIVLPATGSGPHPLIVLSPTFIGEGATNAAHYSADVQYLASRGYAVARFAPRGQFGFGRKFSSAGNFKLSDKVAEDLEDGIQHLAAEGVVDLARVAMDGTSYRALFALYAGRGVSPYRALILREPAGTPTAEDLTFQFDRRRDLHLLYADVGGVDTAYQMMQRFNPAKTVPEVRAAVLLVGPKEAATTDVENLLRNHKRNYVRFTTEWSDRNEDWRKYDYRVAREIADFLDQQMPVGSR